MLLNVFSHQERALKPDTGRVGANKAQAGFSMVELLITMVVAAILGTVVIRFYKDSYRTYSQQEQIADRDQNAQFVLTRMVETVQQAGNSLPDSGWQVIKKTGDTLTVGANPRGAVDFIGTDPGNSILIGISDAKKYKTSGNLQENTTFVLVDFQATWMATAKYEIDQSCTVGGFPAGLKDNATGLDSICLKTEVDLSIGDVVYGYREDQFLILAGNLILRPDGSAAAQMVLAENMDSLGFTFRNATGAATTDWRVMRSASITVRARTEKPDPRLPPPGYRKITLPMNVILRNKS